MYNSLQYGTILYNFFFCIGAQAMTLQDLYDRLVPSFPPSIHKDLKTAVRVLATALQCPTPQACALEQYTRPLSALYRLVETLLIDQGKSGHTIRNIKNNLSRLFRLAEAQHLFSLQPLPLTPRTRSWTKPRRLPDEFTCQRGIYLMYANWPPPLQDAYTAFATWATTPLVPDRNAALRKRLRSVENYCHAFEGYFGFLHHIHHLAPLTFEHLFDLTLVTAYVHWHVNELHKRSTKTLEKFLVCLLALTRQYRPLPELHAHLVALRKTLPRPTPIHNKEDVWVSLSTLRAIGHALWPSKQPHQIRSVRRPGARFAGRAGLSLMLQLWTYVPYRQRNMREMQLGDHLHKDPQGTWRLTFRGEQLKIAVRRGRTNVFDLPFPPTLVPLLEEYLQVWRPLLLQGTHPSSAVFLTEHGTPYTQTTLSHKTGLYVYRYTGKHWHPHIIRSVWATECIRETGDFYAAAVMLNDKLETVIANYAHLREENVAEKVYRLLDERNGQGK